MNANPFGFCEIQAVRFIGRLARRVFPQPASVLARFSRAQKSFPPLSLRLRESIFDIGYKEIKS